MVHDPYSFHGPRYIAGPSAATEVAQPHTLPSRRRDRGPARKPRPPRSGAPRAERSWTDNYC
jgi:hypothetical protein